MFYNRDHTLVRLLLIGEGLFSSVAFLQLHLCCGLTVTQAAICHFFYKLLDVIL